MQLLVHEWGRLQTGIDAKLTQHHIVLSGGSCLMLINHDIKVNTPILVLFPSLTTCSDNFGALINHVCNRLGWRVAVVHKKGQHCQTDDGSGFDMLGDDDETEILLVEIRKYFKRGPMCGYGLSAGAIMMSRFLCKRSAIAKELDFRAGVAVAGAFDLSMVKKGSSLLRLVLAWNCKKRFNLPVCVLGIELWEMAHSCSPLWMSRPFEDFIREMSVSPHLENLRVPLLSIHSRDDPVFFWDDSYKDLSERQPLLQMVVTNSGSHGVFFTGSKLSWAEETALNFLSSEDVLQFPLCAPTKE